MWFNNMKSKLAIGIRRLFHKRPNGEQQQRDEEKNKKLLLQKAYLPSGIFPREFSITLGLAPCNHKCLFCPQSVRRPKEKHWMDLGVLEKMLNEMPEKNIRLNVSSYSETMLNPILFDALKMMKSIRPHLPIVLATNGSAMTENNVRRLIEIGLDELSYSFDAGDRENYKRLIQVDDFTKVESNLEMVCKIRSQMGSKMRIQTHLMAFENQKEIFERFKAKWEGKVDSVYFRPVGNWGDTSLGLKKQLRDNGFVPIYTPPRDRYPCTSIFMHMKIGPDGYYYPCVAYTVVDRHDELHQIALGDAREITFKEAWNRLEEHRQKHLAGRWDELPFCSSCDVWGLWENMWYRENGKFSLDKAITKLNYWK